MVLPWWAWVVFAGSLGLAELHVPGSYLAWIALGAALTSVVHGLFGVSLEGQLATFAAASAFSCTAGYFVYRRLGRRRGETQLNDRGTAMLGARGTVCEAFANGHGKVRLGDTVWLANGPNLAEGAAVVVTAVRGTRLVVDAVGGRPAAGPAAAAQPP